MLASSGPVCANIRYTLLSLTCGAAYIDHTSIRGKNAGKYNVLQVTGVVRLALPGDDDKTLAVCMLSHARLGAESTLGAAGEVWIARGGLRDVIDFILSLLKFGKEEKKQLAKTRLSTVWPTTEQKKTVLKAVRQRAEQRDFEFGGDWLEIGF